MWLLIGSFAASRKVIIFTDKPESFNAHLEHTESDFRSKIKLLPTADASKFDLNCELSPWSNFRNKEAISEFEAT